MRLCLLSLVALLGASATSPTHTDARENAWADVNVFVSAHPDDWQLFMNPAAFRSMDEADELAVFIHVTAGDAGQGSTGAPTPYFLAREEGALRAIRFMANARGEKGLGAEMQRTTVDRGGRPVLRIAYANAVAYFLRLPDGNFEGPGYETTGWQSLMRLRTQAVPELHAVDGSARYAGWQELTNTLADIVRQETPAGRSLALHFAQVDIKRNPRDHSDHLNSGMAMETVAGGFACATLHRYDEYVTNKWPRNVSGDDYLIDVGTWAATTSGLSDGHAFSTWDPGHNSWLGRSYSRITRPKAHCSP